MLGALLWCRQGAAMQARRSGAGRARQRGAMHHGGAGRRCWRRCGGYGGVREALLGDVGVGKQRIGP